MPRPAHTTPEGMALTRIMKFEDVQHKTKQIRKRISQAIVRANWKTAKVF
jgi:hypothetical protein